MRDEGRPFGASFQERASNHPKLLRAKAVVVSVGGKVRGYNSGQVRSGETSASKPFDDASIGINAAGTRGDRILWEECAGYLVTGRAAAGVKGA